jgi:hypothetical protein
MLLGLKHTVDTLLRTFDDRAPTAHAQPPASPPDSTEPLPSPPAHVAGPVPLSVLGSMARIASSTQVSGMDTARPAAPEEPTTLAKITAELRTFQAGAARSGVRAGHSLFLSLSSWLRRGWATGCPDDQSFPCTWRRTPWLG